jgi:hypothetical protein
MTNEARDVAKRLTAAQIVAISGPETLDGSVFVPFKTRLNTGDWLVARRLAFLEGHRLRLTDFGLEVRAILQAESAER